MAVRVCPVLAAVLVIAAAAPAGAVEEAWVARRDGGPASAWDRATHVVAGGDGRVVVAGESLSGFLPAVLVVAYDREGNELWARTIEAEPGGARVGGLAMGAGGDVVISAWRPGAYLTARIDGDGRELWRAEFAPQPVDSRPVAAYPRAVAVSPDGVSFVAGHPATVAYDAGGEELWSILRPSFAAAPVEGGDVWLLEWPDAVLRDAAGRRIAAVPGPWEAIAAGPGGRLHAARGELGDLVVGAFDRDGREAWTVRLPGLDSSDAGALQLSVDAGGSTVVSGWTWDFGDCEYRTVRLTPDGEVAWTGALPGSGADCDEVVLRQAVDPSGNVSLSVADDSCARDNCLTARYDAGGALLWTRDFGRPAIDSPAAVAVDPEGNTYTVGSTGGDRTGLDFLTVAHDVGGVEVWSATADGPGSRSDAATAIVAAGDGGAFVAGRTCDVVECEFETVRYDAGGAELWSARFHPAGGGAVGTSDAAVPSAIARTSDGGVLVGGSKGLVRYDAAGRELWSAPAPAARVAVGDDGSAWAAGLVCEVDGCRIELARFDPGGAELWTRVVDEHATVLIDFVDLVLDPEGDAVLLGTAPGADGRNDYVAARYDAAGERVWMARFGPGRRWYRAAGIAAGEGGVYVAGAVATDGEADPEPPDVIRLDRDGGVAWSRPFAAEGEARAVRATPDGGAIVAGQRRAELVAVRFDAAGSRLWEARTGGERFVLLGGLALDLDANAYLAGVGACGNTFCLTTVRLDSAGREVWSADIPGADSQTLASIDAGAEGDVFVAGAASEDFLAVKYAQEAPTFRRGDANLDGRVDISDGRFILDFLFLGAASARCLDAADTDDSGRVDISDAIAVFNYLFLGGAPPPAPELCGPDPTPDRLGCDSFTVCR